MNDRFRCLASPRRRVADRAGFILISVLWLLVALSAVGLHAGLQLRTERLAAANQLDDARARAAAGAGVEYARSRLTSAMLDRADELRAQSAQAQRGQGGRTFSVDRLFRASDPLEDPWRDPEELVVPEMAFGDARFALRLRDTAAALNLNAADEEMLRNFFSLGLGVEYQTADRLAQAILDWRDEDDLARPGGAERDDYLRAGAAVLPANRPFAELEELRHVMGMTPEIYERALPFLTLTGVGRINVNAAPEPVLLALPGMTPALAREILAMREGGAPLPRSTGQLIRLLSGEAEVIRRNPQAFNNRVVYATNEVEITADGQVEGSPVVARVRVIVSRSSGGALVVSREYR